MNDTIDHAKLLDEIEERFNRTSKGRWYFRVRKPRDGEAGTLVGAVAPGHQILSDTEGGTYPTSDGDFMAQSHADVPRLVTALRRAMADMPHGDRCDDICYNPVRGNCICDRDATIAAWFEEGEKE